MKDSEKFIQKRDGRYSIFDPKKIANAISKAFKSVGKKNPNVVLYLTEEVEKILERKFFERGIVPGVEEIQDLVEKVLIEKNEAGAAKAYILYREKRAEMRDLRQNFLDGIKVIDEADWAAIVAAAG